jgi:hypothetical protein
MADAVVIVVSDLQKVEDLISECERDVKTAEANILSPPDFRLPQYWIDEKIYLREKESDLRKKESDLRKKESDLREEKKILREQGFVLLKKSMELRESSNASMDGKGSVI